MMGLISIPEWLPTAVASRRKTYPRGPHVPSCVCAEFYTFSGHELFFKELSHQKTLALCMSSEGPSAGQLYLGHSRQETQARMVKKHLGGNYIQTLPVKNDWEEGPRHAQVQNPFRPSCQRISTFFRLSSFIPIIQYIFLFCCFCFFSLPPFFVHVLIFHPL